jgi:hypothetical protein
MKPDYSVHTEPSEERNVRAPMTWTDIGYSAVTFFGAWLLVSLIVWLCWSAL